MSKDTINVKNFFASALLTTGLLGVTPAMSEEIRLPTEQEEISPRVESQLCNQQFRCSETGFVVQFLPNFKAYIIHPETDQILKADYRVQFNCNIAMNIHLHPSKSFDMMMHNVIVHADGFVASVNREDRYFQKV